MVSKTLISNRYMLVKHIGKGGMADVYVAVDTVLKREVAVKILKGELSSDPIALERFRREAGASTKLSHPNIVDIYDVGDDGLDHYIVMEYIRGKSLKQLIKQRGPLYYTEAISMMKQLCSAIMEAHRNGIIHRDIKSQNVIIKADGTVKVLDFGIALANNAMQITNDDSVLGSVHYLAPEVAKGEVASMQSDIYSLGVVFYELLTASLPFNGEGAVQVVLNSIKNKIPSVKAFDGRIPQSVENIILKATAKNRKNRYKNVAEMLKDINECLLDKHKTDAKVSFEFSENLIVKDKEEKNKETKPKNKKHSKTILTALVILLVSSLLVIGITFILYISGIIGFKPKMVEVPNILNLRILEAQDKLEEYGLMLDLPSIERELTPNTKAGLIIRVEPEIGSEIEKGSTIKIVVSDGIYAVMDDYVGKTIEEAKEALAQYPNIRIVSNAVASEKEPGTILSQTGIVKDQQFNPDQSQTITFTYSEYRSVMIPFELINMKIDSAENMMSILDVDYVLERVDRNSLGLSDEEIEKIESGTIVNVNPSVGTYYTQSADSFITLYYVD